MKLAFQQAVVPERKITAYLLSPTHPDGRSKEKFFTAFDFSINNWKGLSSALTRHAADNEVTKVEDTALGTRYVVEGIIYTPDNRNPLIRSVWFIEKEENIPRFVPAYPFSQKRE